MNSLEWKRLLGALWRPLRSGGSRRLILLYHSVDGGEWSTAGRVFREQMAVLARFARVERLDELLRPGGASGLRVALTFDDGYRSVFSGAAPVLQDLGLVATVYVNAGWIGEASHRASDPREGQYPGEAFMTWSELSALQAQGWTVGSHGWNHVDLTRTPAKERAQELARSKAEIERRLESSCEHFAFTWGRHDAQVRSAVADAGYATAATALHGRVSDGVDPFALPRIDVPRQYTAEDLAAVVQGDWDYLRWIQGARRLVGTLRGGA